MATISPKEIQTLDYTRQRLAQLTNSLDSLKNQILASDPLPPWSSLHTLSQMISINLTRVADHLTEHSALLSSLAAYPLPSYPGREQEPLLNQLLRKKLEPHVEDWVEEGRRAGEEVGDAEGWMELWEWAGREETLEELIKGREGGGEEEEEEEDEEEEDEEVGDEGGDGVVGETGQGTGNGKGQGDEDKEPMAMEEVLRFLMRGEEVKR